MGLCEDGAAHVDEMLWHVAHKVGPAQLLRLVEVVGRTAREGRR